MTLASANEIIESWEELPPACVSLARIAAWLGATRRSASTAVPRSATAEDLGVLREILIGTGDVHHGLGGAAILDFETLKAKAVNRR